MKDMVTDMENIRKKWVIGEIDIRNHLV